MGAKDSKPCCISYDEAVKRVSESEFKRLRDAFKQVSNLNGISTKQNFIKEVLGEFVPLKLAEHIFQVSGGTNKGISFKDLLCGLVILTRGSKDEKIKFIFSLYANELGTHVVKDEMVKLVQACDGGYVSEAIADCFSDSEKVSYEEFYRWLVSHQDATSLTRWLLNEPCSVSLVNDLETPTFYQTLAGVTHLEESDIIDLEKRYWSLLHKSRTGKFDLETLAPLISPPVPLTLCEGIFNAFDENQDGHIDFKEMACGISACCKGPVAERQKFCFKVFDQDRDGFLSFKEIHSMIMALVHVKSENVSMNENSTSYTRHIDEVVSDLFKSFDDKQERLISLDEYLVWSVGQTLPLDFISLLFQVCHVVFGLRPTTKLEEGDIIRSWLEREERRGMKVGQLWFLIAMDWWRLWNDYIDYQNDPSFGSTVGTSSLKRSLKLQKRVDSSLAQSLGDGNSNVTLSSIVLIGEDALNSLSSQNGINGVGTGDQLMGIVGQTSGNELMLSAKSLLPPDLPRTPGHSPGLTRKLTAFAPPRPPSIDNSMLITQNNLKATSLTVEGGKLKKTALLMRGQDFEIVPEAIWRALAQWYGGSPALPRQVIQPSNSNQPELELFPVTLKLFKHHSNNVRQPNNSWTGVVSSVASAYGGTTGAAYTNQYNNAFPKRYLAYLAAFSRMATLRQVYDFLCLRLRLRPEDTRLWLYKDDNNLLLLDEEYYTLEQLQIEDGEQILIEVRNKDQTWPEEMSNLLNTKLDQKHQQGPTERGATGLNNLGNTCFMNAALQCVSNTRPLTLYFRNERHLYELNRINPIGMKGHIAKRYGDLVQELWSGTSRTIPPLKLRWTIGKYAPRFNGFQQHDSQELLAFLMDGLHEDLNRVHDKPYVELKDSDGRPDSEVAQEAWENHILRNRSIIVDLFHGQLQSSVTCKVCGHISVRFDPFNYLSLPLPMESCIHLEVTVMKLDGSIPVKYALRLNHDDKYSTLKGELSSLCSLSPQQMLLTEVSNFMIKGVLLDSQRVRLASGVYLYVYELPLSSSAQSEGEEQLKGSKETHTFTQIQRMVSLDLSKNAPKKNMENGEPSFCLPIGCSSKTFLSNKTEDADYETNSSKILFRIGDNDSPGPSSIHSSSCESSLGGGYDSPSLSVNSTLGSTLSFGSEQPPPPPPPSPNPLLSQNPPTSCPWTPSTGSASNDSTPSAHSSQGPSLLGSNGTEPNPLSQLNGTQTFGIPGSNPPSLCSSLVSNSSTPDLTEASMQQPFLIAYHRKMMRQDVYFLSHQKSRPTLFGLPLVLPCQLGQTTHQDLYQMVWLQVARLVSPLPPSETAVSNHAQDCDDSLGYEYPFILKAVQKDGVLCAWCPWFRFCRGCQINCGDSVFKGAAYLAIDWDPTALHLRYQAPLEKDFVIHESVEVTRRLQTEPINLHSCLKAFTKEEHLGEEEKYHCSKCKTHQLASKKLQIWRLPPILIVHLKRFQLLNNRWVKSHKIVRFPFCDFEPKEYLAHLPQSTVSPDKIVNSSPDIPKKLSNGDVPHKAPLPSNGSLKSLNQSPKSYINNNNRNDYAKTEGKVIEDFHGHRLSPGSDPFSLKYKLYAIACHSGILGGGHYVSYACNPNNRWYCYNDSSCKEVQSEQIDADSAYMLFYEREGIDYEAYLPNVEGRLPDTKEIDDEFESDFRKMCSLQ